MQIRNSRHVVDEDDNAKVRLDRVKYNWTQYKHTYCKDNVIDNNI